MVAADPRRTAARLSPAELMAHRESSSPMTVGFINVLWDGLVHAWIQDVMVAKAGRDQGIARSLVAMARDQARAAGCEWLHVDFDDDLRAFYFDACGFTPTNGGLIALQQQPREETPRGSLQPLAHDGD